MEFQALVYLHISQVRIRFCISIGRFSSIDFLEVSTFFRGTLLLFSLDFDDILRAVAGEEGTGIFVSFTDDVDENGWS